jgi:hypothetical protein
VLSPSYQSADSARPRAAARGMRRRRYICVGVKEWKLTLLSASEAQGAALLKLFLPYVYPRIEFKIERKNRGKYRNFASRLSQVNHVYVCSTCSRQTHLLNVKRFEIKTRDCPWTVKQPRKIFIHGKNNRQQTTKLHIRLL